MGFWDDVGGFAEDVGKWAAPMVYYPTKLALDAGGKVVNGENPLGSLFPEGTEWRATTPTVDASGFSNPSATPTPGIGSSLRGDLAMDLNRMRSPRPAPQAAGAQLDTGLMQPGIGLTQRSAAQAAGARALERDALGRLQVAAAGKAPSAAEAQMKLGLGQALRGNLAAAASARGTAASKVAAQRAAMDANSALSSNVLGQTAALRAGEQATARGQLVGAAQGLRTGDLSTGQLGLGLGQLGLGAGTAQLQADTSTQIANLDAKLRQTGMDDQRRIQTLGAILGIDARTQEGQIELQKLLTEASLRTQAINAGIEVGNTQAGMQLLGAGIGGASTFGAALV